MGSSSPKLRSFPRRRETSLGLARNWVLAFAGMIGFCVVNLTACADVQHSGGISSVPNADRIFAETSTAYTSQLGLEIGQSREASERIIRDNIYPKIIGKGRQQLSVTFNDVSETEYVMNAMLSNIPEGTTSVILISALYETSADGQDVLVRHGARFQCSLENTSNIWKQEQC